MSSKQIVFNAASKVMWVDIVCRALRFSTTLSYSSLEPKWLRKTLVKNRYKIKKIDQKRLRRELTPYSTRLRRELTPYSRGCAAIRQDAAAPRTDKVQLVQDALKIVQKKRCVEHRSKICFSHVDVWCALYAAAPRQRARVNTRTYISYYILLKFMQ